MAGGWFDKIRTLPLSILVWLANPWFIVIAVMIEFWALLTLVNPPRTVAEAFLEAHKIQLVGAGTLSAVAIVEAPFLRSRNIADLIIRGFYLAACIFVALMLFQKALVISPRFDDVEIAVSFISQFIVGLVLVAVPCIVTVRAKYIDWLISIELDKDATAWGNRP